MLKPIAHFYKICLGVCQFDAVWLVCLVLALVWFVCNICMFFFSALCHFLFFTLFYF